MEKMRLPQGVELGVELDGASVVVTVVADPDSLAPTADALLIARLRFSGEDAIAFASLVMNAAAHADTDAARKAERALALESGMGHYLQGEMCPHCDCVRIPHPDRDNLPHS